MISTEEFIKVAALPGWTWGKRKPRRALIIGGTRGIGAALAGLLSERGWDVEAWGRDDLDLRDWPGFLLELAPLDFVCFCAGDLEPLPWDRKTSTAYIDSYLTHAAGPVLLLAANKNTVFPWWTKVCFVSSVGAINDGIVDLAYGMAKAALEKAAKALAEHEAWDVHLVRFDLVDTDTMYKLPTDTLHGRPVLSAREAAEQIVKECGL